MSEVLRSPAAALLIALALTLGLGWETRRSRWAPFFLFHAVLAIALPLYAGSWPKGNPLAALTAAPMAWMLCAFALPIWELGLAGLAYESWLRRRGYAGDPRVSPAAALEAALLTASRRLGLSVRAVSGLFAAYAVLWAPLGEDLFFWGYLLPSLAGGWGFWPAACAASVLFGIHHWLYLGGRTGGTGRAAGLAFAGTSVLSGILLALAFRISRSLYPVMAMHLATNLAWVAASAFARRSAEK
ncbi:MAG: CPBP family intramembrane metalloprotease [Fibrobacteres bacterium]|nr:CPBP family intramembrane metalloprotease [Fibrobacterota bacterium]